MITSFTGLLVADVPPKGGCNVVDGGGGAGLLVVALLVGLALRRRR